MKTRVITAVVGLAVLAAVLAFFDTIVFDFVLSAICLLDCTQTPRDRNGDYLATVEDTSIVNAKLMIWDG